MTIYAVASRYAIYLAICLLSLILLMQIRSEIRRSATNFNYGVTKEYEFGSEETSRESKLYLQKNGPPVAQAIPDDDEHIKMIATNPSFSNAWIKKKTKYPRRVNMGDCPKLFGKILVLVIAVESSYKTHYHVAQESLKCYLKSTNYTFKVIDMDHDERVNKYCKHDQLFFKKHCAASVYLPDTDWMLVLDADAGVVNPNHCIEEWIDDRVDLVFYERYFNWEIARAQRLFPGKIRILRRAHGWVRDGYLTTDSWCERDFMLHGWKQQTIDNNGWQSPFKTMFNVTECSGGGYSGWNWRNEKRLDIEGIRIQLANFEHSVGNSFPKQARVLPYLTEPDVGNCYPNCDDET